MKPQVQFIGAAGALCIVASLLPSKANAVTDDEFNALKALVEQQGQKIDQLEKIHNQDQQQLQQLKRLLAETQTVATNAEFAATNAAQKAESAMQVQPVSAMPPPPSRTHNFMVVGDAEVQFGKVEGQNSGFQLADFAPIFLFRKGDNLLFEAGFDVTLQNNAPSAPGATTSIGLSFAQMDYLLNDYMTFVGGYMLLPLGTYTERSAGWLNKMPDDPLPRSVLPSAGAGVQLRGAVPIAQSGQMLTYSVYGANGPSSSDGTDNANALDLGGNIGINSDGSTGNLHASPSGGGRIGWFYPWKAHYDLELGVSGQTGKWDNADQRRWSAAVLDAALHVGPNVEVKGEYINTWAQTGDAGTIHPWGWWMQAGYKLAGLNLNAPIINNLELVGRYDTVRNGLGTSVDRWTVGYVYYFSNTFLFEGDYEFVNSNDPTQNHNAFVLQLSFGF
jgi:hypothetical protein